jgi:hypothetical protein
MIKECQEIRKARQKESSTKRPKSDNELKSMEVIHETEM